MIRELKLYDLCGIISPNVIELNVFFNDLFSDLSVYTKDGKPDLIFMKRGKYIMGQDLKNNYLRCNYTDFWLILKERFNLKTPEIQEVISYKVVNMIEEAFKTGSLTPNYPEAYEWLMVEEAFKTGSLTPGGVIVQTGFELEEAFKTGSLTKIY